MYMGDFADMATPDAWLGVFPGWVGDLVTIILAALGLPTIIALLLQRRNANRHMNVEEGGLRVNEFGEIKSGYRDLWTAARADADAARKDAEQARSEAASAREEAEKAQAAAELATSHAEAAENSVRKLRELIDLIVKESGYKLDTKEIEVIQETEPRPIRPRGHRGASK